MQKLFHVSLVYANNCIPERCSQRNVLRSVPESWMEMGVVAACFTHALMRSWPRLTRVEASSCSRFLQILPGVRPTYKTRNQFELSMRRPYVSLGLLALVVGLSLGSLALAPSPSGGGHSTLPWVAATVIALEPRGMATTRTVDGMTSTVIKETTWRLGDTVACEHVVRTRVPCETLDCRKTS